MSADCGIPIAQALFGFGEQGSVIVLGAFFDDSGTHDDSPVVVLGGVLGNAEQLERFKDEWETLLRQPLPGKPPLKGFHLSACRSKSDEFRDYNQAECDRVTYLFRQIILRAGLVTISTAMNYAAWRELVTGKIAEQLGRPIEFCFVKCVDTAIGTIRLRKPDEKIAMVFDQGTRARLESWAHLYLSQSDRYPEIIGMGFGKVNDVPALQAADMIATETYQYGQEWLKNGENAVANAHFREYLKRELSTGLVVDRESIAETVSRVRASLASREQPS